MIRDFARRSVVIGGTAFAATVLALLGNGLLARIGPFA